MDLRKMAGQFARFGVSTGFSATMSFGLPIILHEWLGVAQKPSVAIGFATAYVGNIALLRLFVFRSTGSWLGQLARYIPVNGCFRIVEYLGFVVLLDHFGLDYRLAMLAVLGTSSLIKFFAYRLIFLDRAERSGAPAVLEPADSLER